eukprot:gene5262-10530_t
MKLSQLNMVSIVCNWTILPINILWIFFLDGYLAQILQDPSTSSYFKHVYGQDTKTAVIDVNLIDMVYLHKHSQIVFPGANEYWDRGHYISRNDQLDASFYQDYEWAEVIRESTLCRFPGRNINEGYSRGLSKKGQAVMPYGCWFNRYRGSGIFVNVGKSISATSRKDLTLQFGIRDCENATSLNCREINDNMYCTFALKLGYDSIQVDSFEEFGAYNKRRPELVICSGKCATVPFNTSCPPGVELRTGLDGSRPSLMKSYVYVEINKQQARRAIYQFWTQCFGFIDMSLPSRIRTLMVHKRTGTARRACSAEK